MSSAELKTKIEELRILFEDLDMISWSINDGVVGSIAIKGTRICEQLLEEIK